MQPKNMKIAITGGDILTPLQVYERGTILIEDGFIRQVGHGKLKIPEDFQILDASDHWVTPGLIDIHTHGLLGFDNFGSGLANTIPRYPQFGITSFLATSLSAPPDVTTRNIVEMAHIISQNLAGADCLGIHLEGPYLSPRQAGFANPAHLRPFNREEVAGWQQTANGMIKVMTVAPERLALPGDIQWLKSQGIYPSAGHTDASYAVMNQAIEAGLSMATHIFNAMPVFHHRQPGALAALLLAENIYCELIGDGVHVDPAAIKLLIEIKKGVDRIVLVSDSAPAAGLAEGQYEWDGQEVMVRSSSCQTQDGSLAGSCKGLDAGLRQLTFGLNIDLPKAIQTVTTNPAKLLQLETKGALAAGMQADIAWFDRELQPVLTLVQGQTVWRRAS
jgi:N-acetylglucosamine-6-phosphate deacetylase